MQTFEWKEAYTTDVKSMDKQHHKLHELLNHLCHEIDRGAPRTELMEHFTELIRLTSLHFLYEERLLGEQGYPDLEAHRQEHKLLMARATALLKLLDEGKLDFSRNLTLFMDDWLGAHIVNTDQKYANFLIRHGVQ